MSVNGRADAELQEAVREQLRLGRVRQEAHAVLNACNTAIAGVTEPAVQQLAAAGLQAVRGELAGVSGGIDREPDSSLSRLRSAQDHLHRVLADAKAAANRWSKEQAKAQARITQVQAMVDAAQDHADEQSITAIRQHLTEARSRQQAGRYSQAIQSLEVCEKVLEQGRQKAFDETVRREVVRGLLGTLQGMGFATEDPELDKSKSEAGVVKLTGETPSKRKAVFEVDLNGGLAFDFDGYQDRTCGKDLEKIEKVLQEQFGVKLGPPQIRWKNPDRITQTARPLPTGVRASGGR